MTIITSCITKKTKEADSTNGVTCSIVYGVTFSGDWNPDSIMDGSGGLPVIGSVIDGLYVNKLNADLVQAPLGGTGVATLTISAGEFSVTAVSPLSQPDTVVWSTSEETRDIFFDNNSPPRPIVNSAGDVFAQLPNVSFPVRRATITGYRSSLLLPPISEFRIVNDRPSYIDGYGALTETLCLLGAETSKERINGYTVWKHQWQIAAKPDAKWDLYIANFGYRQKKTGKVERIVFDNVPVEVPWPLDSSGLALPKTFSPATDIVNLRFKVTEQYNFDTFGWHF